MEFLLIICCFVLFLFLCSCVLFWPVDIIAWCMVYGVCVFAKGYLYFHDAPSVFEGHKDSSRLVQNLCFYDVCRVDRTVTAHGLEVRVPFLDKTFVQMYKCIDPHLRSPKYKGVEKYLVRKAFDKGDLLLPKQILWRTKEAFSDGVSSLDKPWHVLLAEFAESQITEQEWNEARCAQLRLYGRNMPLSKESLWYRKVYNEMFGSMDLLPYYWLPQWNDATDPSARTIQQYDKTAKAEGQQAGTTKAQQKDKRE